MKIQQIASIEQIGKRKNYEDCIWPAAADLTEAHAGNLFIVCDGVGGLSKGEIASEITCQAVAEFLQRRGQNNFSEAAVQQAVGQAEAALDSYVSENPASEGMATTLTLLNFNGDEATAAHVGDSRIYHIRNGEILFESRDHSLVADLVASGYITEDEAQHHPRKNEITRAVQTASYPSEADVTFLRGIQPGDYFILCTDGILESVNKAFLKQSFVADADLHVVVNAVKKLCADNSKDNHSGIFIKTGIEPTSTHAYIEAVAQKTGNTKEIIISDTLVEPIQPPLTQPAQPKNALTYVDKINTRSKLFIALVVVGFGLLIGGLYHRFKKQAGATHTKSISLKPIKSHNNANGSKTKSTSKDTTKHQSPVTPKVPGKTPTVTTTIVSGSTQTTIPTGTKPAAPPVKPNNNTSQEK